MTSMARIAARLRGGAHARASGLAGVVRENPLLAGVAGIGFSVSFQTVAHIATQQHMPGPPVLYPAGIDVGILALITEALHLIRDKRSDFVPRVLAWVLTGFTIYVNVHGSPSGDWLGEGLHMVMPALWVICLELVRHRRVSATRADGIPLGRWVAAPVPTLTLWLRMKRDGITSYPLALEMEQARLFARDLIRAAPKRYRPRRSSLIRKRIRSGRLREDVRKAVAGSIGNEWAPGWEETVTTWVTTALALPGYLVASLENTRRDAAREASRSDAGSESRSDSGGASASAGRSDSADRSGDTPRSAPDGTARKRRVVPAKATDDELAELVLPLFEDGSEVTKYRVIKAIKAAAGGKASIGDKRAGDVLELARRKRVVPIKERQRA